MNPSQACDSNRSCNWSATLSGEPTICGQSSLVANRRLRHPGLGLHQVVDEGLAIARDCVGLANDRIDRRQNQAFVRRTALRDDACLHVLVKGLHVGFAVLQSKHQLAPAGGKVAPTRRRASLHDHGPTLRRARYRQRPACADPAPLIVDVVHLVGIGVDATLLVQQRTGCRTFPVRAHGRCARAIGASTRQGRLRDAARPHDDARLVPPAGRPPGACGARSSLRATDERLAGSDHRSLLRTNWILL
jgi:hypothetical protein